MISKELLSEVLNLNITYIERYNNSIIYKISVYDREEEFNIYELAHKCKEWALSKGYYLASNKYSDGGCCQYFTEDSNECASCGGIKSNIIHAESEQQAVFNVCQWILDNKGTKWE